ncbi:hypothetical protein A2U01_0037099, partial [Trifolium medium]|nr:hypothetical protein [Trifolium medium]
MCTVMTTGINNNHPNIAYPRLLSELFQQTGLVEGLRPVYPSLFKEFFSEPLTAKILDSMEINKNIIAPETFKERVIRTRFYNNGFPVISQADLIEVQQFFVDDVNKETGAKLTLKDVPPAPEMFMPKRGKRKTKDDVEKKPLKKAGSSNDAADKSVQPKALNEEEYNRAIGLTVDKFGTVSERRTKHKHDDAVKATEGKEVIKGSGK